MVPIRFQFLLGFGVFGAWLPFFSVYLGETCGFSEMQIGMILAAGSVAVLLTPVLVTFLADAHLPARLLLAIMFAVAGAGWLGMYFSGGQGQFWPVLLLFVLYSLAYAPITPLSDGLFFNEQQRRLASGLHAMPYHRVRVYGTIGFLVPNVVLFLMLRSGMPIETTVLVAAAACGLAFLNTFLLPKIMPDSDGQTSEHGGDESSAPGGDELTPGAADTDDQPGGGSTVERKRSRIPTLAAAKALMEPHVLVFCVALFLVQLAVAPYYTFYPRYLRAVADIDVQWLGLIACIGVTIEIFFVLAFGRLTDWLGLKTLMVVGVLFMTVRLLLLGLVPTPLVAVGSQVFHGMWVLVVHVAPPLYLSRRATGAFRNSILGLFAIVVYGSGRILGNVIAGYVAERDLRSVFLYSAVLCMVAAVLLLYAFKDEEEATGEG